MYVVCFLVVKFRYSEKATKIVPSSTYNLTLLRNVKKLEDGPNICCFLRISELQCGWEPGQHFDIDIGAVDVVVVIDDEGTAVLVVEAVEAVEAMEAVEVER